jgi:hypothetical protein
MKKSVKDQTARAFQTGGYNPPAVPQSTQPYSQPTQVDPRTGTYTLPGTGIAGYQIPSGTPTGYTPYGGAQPYFQPVQFTGAQYQTALQTTNLPTFAETVGNKPGQYDELRTYINDAGQTLQIPFKDGKPIYPIPEGYRPIGDQPAPEEEQTTVTPTVGQTQVRDEGGRDEDTTVSFGGATYSDKGAATKAGADMYGATGVRGADIGMLGTFLSGAVGGLPGLAVSALSKSAFGYDRPGSMGYLGGTEATPGTGFIDYNTLSSTLAGSPLTQQTSELGLTPSQIEARMSVIEGMGITPTGYTGYEMGDAVPGMPGAIMGADGISRMPDGSVARTNGVPTYDSFGAFLDRLSMTTEEKRAHDQAIKDKAAEAMETMKDMKARKEVAQAEYKKQQTQVKFISLVEQAKRLANKGDMDTARSAIENSNALSDAQKANALSQLGKIGASASGTESAGFGPGTGGYKSEAEATAQSEAFERSQRDDRGGGGGGRGGSEAGDPSGGAGLGSGTDCLTEKMKVKLNGVIDFVTNIKVGDIIDGSVVKEVLHKHMRSGYFVINNELEITNDHPVLANGAWTKPEELYIGDYINDVKVESIKYIDRMTPTVSIVVDGDSFDVYTQGNTYTVHGRYREVRQQAA